MLEDHQLIFWIYFDSSGLPGPFLVTEEVLSCLLSFFTLILRLLIISVKTHSQDLDYFIVVVYFLLSGEVLEGSVEARTDLEGGPHASTWDQRRLFGGLNPEIVDLILDAEFHDIHLFLKILGNLEFLFVTILTHTII